MGLLFGGGFLFLFLFFWYIIKGRDDQPGIRHGAEF